MLGEPITKPSATTFETQLTVAAPPEMTVNILQLAHIQLLTISFLAELRRRYNVTPNSPKDNVTPLIDFTEEFVLTDVSSAMRARELEADEILRSNPMFAEERENALKLAKRTGRIPGLDDDEQLKRRRIIFENKDDQKDFDNGWRDFIMLEDPDPQKVEMAIRGMCVLYIRKKTITQDS